MKKCRSRIIFNRDNETAMKNEIMHNHDEDFTLYEAFYKTASRRRSFGRHKEDIVMIKSQQVDEVEEKCE